MMYLKLNRIYRSLEMNELVWLWLLPCCVGNPSDICNIGKVWIMSHFVHFVIAGQFYLKIIQISPLLCWQSLSYLHYCQQEVGVGHTFCGGLSISFRNHTDQNSCLTPSFFPVLATLATGGESYSSSSCLFSYFSSTRPVKSITKWLQDNLDPGSTFPPSNSNRVAVLEAYDDYPDNLAIWEPEI